MKKSTWGRTSRILLVVVLILGLMPAFGLAEGAVSDLSGTITVWGHDDSFDVYTPFFNEAYPNINIQFVIVPDAEMKTKLIAVLSSGATPPDVVNLSIGLWTELRELPVFENLSAAPYDAQQYLDLQYPYLEEISKSNAGDIMGLTLQSCPSGFYYSRRLAKEYLGTDDPAQISEIFSSWEGIFEAGEKVYAASEGKTALLSTWADITALQLPNTGEWVRDGKVYLNDEIYKIFDLVTEARGRNVDAKLATWSPEWCNAVYGNNGSSIGTVCATWLMPYGIMLSGPDTKGDWGLAATMTPFSWGGTWMAMGKDSKNKELAWEYVKYLATDDRFLEKFVSEIGDFSSKESVNQRIAQDNPADEWWGGQNSIEAFSKIAAGAKARVYLYQDEMETTLANFVSEVVNNNMPKETAIEGMKADIRSKFPDLEFVEE